mgnify:CR=1 FL=1
MAEKKFKYYLKLFIRPIFRSRSIRYASRLIESLERRIEFETGDVDCNSEVTKKENEDLVLQDFLEVAKRCLSEKKAETFFTELVAYERNPKLYESDEAFLRTISEM